MSSLPPPAPDRSPATHRSDDSEPSGKADAAAEMNRTWRIFAIPAVIALLGYIVLYATDVRLRERRGPWEATFQVETDGTPAVVLRHDTLGIQDVRVRFVGEHVDTNTPPLPATVRFDQPSAPVPFGKTAFDDLMYLPGTVVLQCFGHEVQMLPRTLYLNRRGVDWSSGKTFDLQASGKLPTLDPPAKLGRLRSEKSGSLPPATPPPPGNP